MPGNHLNKRYRDSDLLSWEKIDFQVYSQNKAFGAKSGGKCLSDLQEGKTIQKIKPGCSVGLENERIS